MQQLKLGIGNTILWVGEPNKMFHSHQHKSKIKEGQTLLELKGENISFLKLVIIRKLM